MSRRRIETAATQLMIGDDMPEERFFDSDGVRLHYLDWGSTGKSLVLLSGLGDSAHLYLAKEDAAVEAINSFLFDLMSAMNLIKQSGENR